MIAYGMGLLAVSVLVAQVVPLALIGAVGGVFGEEPGWAAPVFILMFINIHHYFTEGLIWEDQEPGSWPRIIRALAAALQAARS